MKTKLAIFAVFSALTAVMAVPAAAQTTDDVKWINQCVGDNKDEGQTQQVVLSYCTCMNNEMGNNESRSITQWEKANPRKMEMCSTKAGWKGR